MVIRYLKLISPYLLIAVVIFGFNIRSIYGLDGLIQDDQEYYFRLYDKSVSDLHFSRNLIHPLYILGIIKLASATSVYFARWFIVIFFFIPSAFLLYHLVISRMKLVMPAALAIAIIPFILPNELYMPAYIVGSYMIPAILFALLAVLFILRYSEKKDLSKKDFLLATGFYILAFESSELFASMLPAFLFLVFATGGFSRKQVLLGAVITFLAVVKSAITVLRPHQAVNNVQNDLGLEEIKRRIIHFTDYINPLHGLFDTGYLNLILILMIIAGAVLVLKNSNKLLPVIRTSRENGSIRGGFTRYYLFPLTWLIFSVFPFIFFSQYLVSRYMTTAAIAFNFMLVVSLGVILGSIIKNRLPLIFILAALVLYSGFRRQEKFNENYHKLMEQFSELTQTARGIDLPPGAQVVVTTDNRDLVIGNGISRRSTGSLQFILGRRDVTGQIMQEKMFYDPFILMNNPWKYKNADIDTLKQTYLYRGFMKHSAKNTRLHYALRWADENSKDSDWTIFTFDEKGFCKPMLSGSGYQEYLKGLESLSIKRKDIMFGGKPDRADSLRLGLKAEEKL